ncbi:MAG: AraC family transcriptional regulator [Pseudomonadota bacterium]
MREANHSRYVCLPMKSVFESNPSASDPLAKIIGALDLKGSVFLEGEFTAPWAISAHVTKEDCQPWVMEPCQVIAYHIVTEGELLVSMDAGDGYREHCRATRGDIIFLPSNALHVLASETGVPPVSGDDLLIPAEPDGLLQIRYGGGGTPTRMLCGFMATGSQPFPLLDCLPELLVIHIDSLPMRDWIQASMAMAARELGRGRAVGADFVSSLCRLLLIEALRAHVERHPQPQGWLAGLADPRIARALSVIHQNLSEPPRIEDLARSVAMSRSAFVDRFTDVMGIGPRAYLQAQRLDAASSLLRDTGLSASEVAYRVGYSAPEAFSRAFKRRTGLSPADWRKSA